MIAMQYKISLPDDYDMDNVRKRVMLNGNKTDGFKGLLFKAYLMNENKEGEKGNNEYSPLYLWNDYEAMNTFIFHGFYDNILDSFGWQNIGIGIPFTYNLEKDFKTSKFVIEIEKDITPKSKMDTIEYSSTFPNCTGRLLVYNPDKWKYVEYYFFINRPTILGDYKIYTILHIS